MDLQSHIMFAINVKKNKIQEKGYELRDFFFLKNKINPFSLVETKGLKMDLSIRR